MRYHTVKENPDFVGRREPWRRLQEIDAEPAAAVIVVYGRRRVGKTELLEQFFRDRPILKFEGLQPDRTTLKKKSKREKLRQIDECLGRLDRYTESEHLYRRMKIERWSDFFDLLLPYVEKDPVILYFEELQWLANYGNDFLSDFKPRWDEVLRHNRMLRVVVSGSAPAFIVNQFVSTSAMYNRSTHMLKLEPFNLAETAQLLQKGPRETLLAAIAVGGIPEYLKQLKTAPSVYAGLCDKSFRPGGFFRLEKDRIFVSSLSANRSHEDVLDYLAQHRHATRNQLYKAMSRKHSRYAGGSFTAILQELVEVGFVEKYAPLTVGTHKGTSHFTRYAIADEYLHFYYRFIETDSTDIDAGKFIDKPTAALNPQDFSKLMGLAFERWCRKQEFLIARRMKFGGVVDYQHGAWYEKSSLEKDGLQIDLMYIRKDSKIIICEIKYNNDAPLGRAVIHETQEKLECFRENNPKYRRYTFETALVTAEPVPEAIGSRDYFTYLITADDLLRTASESG